MFIRLLLVICFSVVVVSAQDSKKLSISLQKMDFDNSTQKKQGDRLGVDFWMQQADREYTFVFEKTNTNTYQPPLPNDLFVNKYAAKFRQRLSKAAAWQASLLHIEDNLASTDSGTIYGIGFDYKGLHVVQFLSDYDRFKSYQTDVAMRSKYQIDSLLIKSALMFKYIRLQDKNSDAISAHADNSYLTPGLSVNLSKAAYFGGANAWLGKRAFAVMQDGLNIQHHGMEFDKTYSGYIGRRFGAFDATLRYIHMRATELPKWTRNVLVDVYMLTISYRF